MEFFFAYLKRGDFIKVKCPNCGRNNEVKLKNKNGQKSIVCNYCTYKLYFEIENDKAVNISLMEDIYPDYDDMKNEKLSKIELLKKKLKYKNINNRRTKFKNTGWTLYHT